jgi:hypothetical protein
MPVKIIIRSGDKQTTKSHKKIYLSWHKKISWFHHVAGYFCQAGLFKNLWQNLCLNSGTTAGLLWTHIRRFWGNESIIRFPTWFDLHLSNNGTHGSNMLAPARYMNENLFSEKIRPIRMNIASKFNILECLRWFWISKYDLLKTCAITSPGTNA